MLVALLVALQTVVGVLLRLTADIPACLTCLTAVVRARLAHHLKAAFFLTLQTC